MQGPDYQAPDFDRTGPYNTTIDDEDPLGRYENFKEDQEDFPDDDPEEENEDDEDEEE
jgi:hypothetical protein